MEAQTETEAQVAKSTLGVNQGPITSSFTDAQRWELLRISREIAEDVFASRIASALADPDVKGSKSVLGYLLGRARRR